MKKLSLIIVFIFSIFMFSSCKINNEMLPSNENHFEYGFDYEKNDTFYSEPEVSSNRYFSVAAKGKIINVANDVKIELFYGLSENDFNLFECDSYDIFVKYGENDSNKENLLNVNESINDEKYKYRIDFEKGKYEYFVSKEVILPESCFDQISGTISINFKGLSKDNSYRVAGFLYLTYIKVGGTIQFLV